MDSEDRISALVRCCQRGDRAAFETLFTQFQPRLRYYVRRVDSGGNHADDLLQTIWLQVIRKIDSLKDPQAFVAWLYTIARREVYSQGRVRDPFVELTDEQAEQLVEDAEPVFDREDVTRMHQALGKLKASHREILTLSFLEGVSHQEIAQILNLSAGTVKSRVYYAKQALRRALERNHE